MPSRSTATTAANETFTATINGAKDLKEYISRINKLTQEIRAEFENDLKQPCARVEEPNTNLGSRKFDVTMASVAHDSVVHSETVLNQCSEFLQKEQVVDESLAALEKIRKFLVTNREQGIVAIKTIKKLRTKGISSKINDLKKPRDQQTVQQSFETADSVVNADECDFVEIEHESPEDKRFKRLIEQIRQNHRTNARNLCKQAELIIRALRTRDILAYRLSAETTIQKIIRHAKKCNTFIENCRRIARIECCASAWWMETQRDPMDHSPYYLTAVEEGVATRFSESEVDYSALVLERRTPPRILIEVQSANRSSNNSFPIVFSQYLDQELADTILTEEAVRAFEAEEEPTNYRRDYGTIISNCYVDAGSNDERSEKRKEPSRVNTME